MWKLIILSVVVFFLVVFIGINLGIKFSQKPKQEQKIYKIYHMKYGGAYCSHFVTYSCGVTLRDCTDDKEYYCMQDVSVEMDR
jgi:hypothetical protein